MARFGIVGGGLLGMTAAFRLAQAGHAVTIFEAAAHCGGLAAPWQIGGVTWDRHYHVTLYSDTSLRALLDEIGLSAEMNWVTTATGFYTGGTLYPFSNVRDFLTFPPLSLVEKARLGATIVAASRITDWKPLERMTAVAWLTRLSGRTTVEKIWLPLLRAKLGSYADEASAAFIWAIIARMYAARRTGMKRELFGYVRGGYDRVLRRFEERLRDLGIQIETGARVDSVEPLGDGIAVVAGGRVDRFDGALVTLASPLAARVCSSLSERERALLTGVEYQGIVCASLLAPEPLSPYYITNITDAGLPFTAVIEMTALVDRSAFGGYSLIYLPKYAAASDPIFKADDARIEREFTGALQRMHPAFDPAAVRAFRISRVPYVFPVPTVGYSDRLPPVRTGVQGLYIANSTHIVNGTLNVNETVSLANAVAADMLAAPAVRRADALV